MAVRPNGPSASPSPARKRPSGVARSSNTGPLVSTKTSKPPRGPFAVRSDVSRFAKDETANTTKVALESRVATKSTRAGRKRSPRRPTRKGLAGGFPPVPRAHRRITPRPKASAQPPTRKKPGASGSVPVRMSAAAATKRRAAVAGSNAVPVRRSARPVSPSRLRRRSKGSRFKVTRRARTRAARLRTNPSTVLVTSDSMVTRAGDSETPRAHTGRRIC